MTALFLHNEGRVQVGIICRSLIISEYCLRVNYDCYNTFRILRRRNWLSRMLVNDSHLSSTHRLNNFDPARNIYDCRTLSTFDSIVNIVIWGGLMRFEGEMKKLEKRVRRTGILWRQQIYHRRIMQRTLVTKPHQTA